jgi:sporulation protein YlmC with PRC-barrel domain
MTRFILSSCGGAALLIFSASAHAQDVTGATGQSAGGRQPDLTGQVSALSSDALYQGWRARQLIGQSVKAKDGRTVGSVSDIIVDADGRAAALVIEGGGAAQVPDALYRIPWSNVDLTPGQDGVTADLSSGRQPQHALFPGTPGVPILPREFRVREIVGDYARLKTGYGYGIVTDAVFASDGRVIAVLVSRDAAAGGGTAAFPFQGASGPWDASMSYFGLPYITEDQAGEAGLRIEAGRFASSAI